MDNTLTTTAGNGFTLAAAPSNPQEAFALCERFAKSELVPKGFQGKPNDIFIAGMMGARLGLDLFSALAGIAVVNGRATLWGDAMLAVCQARSDWGGMAVEFANEDADLVCTVTVTRKGMPPYSSSFSMSDAKRAGLAGKSGPWTQYPRRMLELRARAFALRGAFADALSGFHSREEMEDAREVEAEVVATTTDPKPARRRTVKDEKPAEEAPKDNATSQGTTSTPGYVTAEDRAEDEAERKAAAETAQETPAAEEKPKQRPPATIESNDKIAHAMVAADKSAAVAKLKSINAMFGLAKLSEAKPEQLANVEIQLLAAAAAMGVQGV